ncbi:MAG: GTPase [Thermoplasmata archaeon]|nr:MAG: GTPase [Thermoplasmata archaeon]
MELFVLGPAGSGKSTFVKAFSEYLEGCNVKCINLDPATPPIYKADIDIRRYIKTEEVMDRYKLGINSALIKSIELSIPFIKNFKIMGDYILYDTPGQMELFLSSRYGRETVDLLKTDTTAGVFLIDTTTIQDAESFLSTIMENVIVTLRLHIPSLTVFTKSDLASIDIEKLKHEIMEKPGVLPELLEKTIEFIEYTNIPQRPIMISNISKKGFDEVLSAINELFCSCGDIS